MSDLSNPKSQRKEQDVQKQIELIESDRNEMDQVFLAFLQFLIQQQ